ncbi:hypothetical protein V6R21_04840 [Limibacter armeniacum]|uniref:hypothetical protein n=1 Tax=Limibacter armeniacum TaxID=466084 RepID=UPI002FE51883
MNMTLEDQVAIHKVKQYPVYNTYKKESLHRIYKEFWNESKQLRERIEGVSKDGKWAYDEKVLDRTSEFMEQVYWLEKSCRIIERLSFYSVFDQFNPKGELREQHNCLKDNIFMRK